jgi:hypothetical protein
VEEEILKFEWHFLELTLTIDNQGKLFEIGKQQGEQRNGQQESASGGYFIVRHLAVLKKCHLMNFRV